MPPLILSSMVQEVAKSLVVELRSEMYLLVFALVLIQSIVFVVQIVIQRHMIRLEKDSEGRKVKATNKVRCYEEVFQAMDAISLQLYDSSKCQDTELTESIRKLAYYKESHRIYLSRKTCELIEAFLDHYKNVLVDRRMADVQLSRRYMDDFVREFEKI